MKTSAITPQQLAGHSVAILGFGRSGRAVADTLLALGATPTVYTQTPVSDEVKAIYRQNGVDFVEGFPQEFRESVLVRSPAIRPDIPPIRRALANGAYLTGECDLFMQSTAATVIGVTGSDGKTTTANLIFEILKAAGRRVVLGGNNGIPLLPLADKLSAGDIAVVELSSFQLMSAPAPDIAVLTNLTPNHLNWHADYEEYAAAKCRALQGAGRAVVSADCPNAFRIGQRSPTPVTWFSAQKSDFSKNECAVWAKGEELVLQTAKGRQTVSLFSKFRLPGRHNRQNFAAAAAATAEFASLSDLLAVAASFSGVEHRLQTVLTHNGIRFINSSIDTSPSRTAAALSALGGHPIVIAGGRGKGIPLAPLADSLATHAKAVFLYGEAAEEIKKELCGRVPTFVYARFARAFDGACACAKCGDTVLLSPGCTAFGEFGDFEERGRAFCRMARAFAGKDIQKLGTSRTDPADGGACQHHGV